MTDVITTGIVMTADPIGRWIERVKENPTERTKDVTSTPPNEPPPGIRTFVARISRSMLNLNANKMHALMCSPRSGQSPRNVCYFLFSSDSHLICGTRRHSCGNFLQANSRSRYPSRGWRRNGCHHCRGRIHDGRDGSHGLRLH